MLKVAIVGCGRIADSHVTEIGKIANCEIVGACDNEKLMAKQLCDRFPIKRYYSDVDELLDGACPDVVHITTPPQSHYKIGMKCLEAGCHVYIEKPFMVNTDEARKIIEFASKNNRRMTVGHDAQFSCVARRMRKLISDGYLGGAPVHMDSYWCYDLGDAVYAKALLDDKKHWARTLPGGLLHNIISHGVAKIAEHFRGEKLRVIAHGFASPFLKKLGEQNLVDELRTIISDELGTTAHFTFSTQMRPSLHQFSIYGGKNGIMLDEDKRLLIKLEGGSYKSYAEHFVPTIKFGGQYLANFIQNIRLFFANDFDMDVGKRYLIEAFYRCVTDGAPFPISYREILATSRIMDAIFEQIRTSGSYGREA